MMTAAEAESYPAEAQIFEKALWQLRVRID
jgi:hypothetical protein